MLVLCYHAVSERWPEVTAIEPERLETQVRRLLRHGWKATTFTEAVLAPPAPRTLAITFDDAFRSVYRFAAPILERLGVVATMFVPAAFPESGRALDWPNIGRWIGTTHERELEPASWAELAALGAAGWEIGSHTSSHARLPDLAPGTLDEELRGSKAEIERRVGRPCRSIAFPYGDVDQRIASAAAAAGYEAGAALLPVRHEHDLMRFPRVFISRDEGDLLHRLHLRRSVRWWQSTAVWPLVQRSLTRSEPRPAGS